ncbi:hypothetical protein SKAU_G00329250 [Synaphobranchus kaupii]|uniref:Uncharacterized protein n=1 Tax=Synaphobranchus kaupii TaxID=118154 RepID=A0A9Q1EQC6_SYNKA|nr:hypothetical protein SKAU_G00329250 [Synaphobranchus kaupii]
MGNGAGQSRVLPAIVFAALRRCGMLPRGNGNGPACGPISAWAGTAGEVRRSQTLSKPAWQCPDVGCSKKRIDRRASSSRSPVPGRVSPSRAEAGPEERGAGVLEVWRAT